MVVNLISLASCEMVQSWHKYYSMLGHRVLSLDLVNGGQWPVVCVRLCMCACVCYISWLGRIEALLSVARAISSTESSALGFPDFPLDSIGYLAGILVSSLHRGLNASWYVILSLRHALISR